MEREKVTAAFRSFNTIIYHNADYVCIFASIILIINKKLSIMENFKNLGVLPSCCGDGLNYYSVCLLENKEPIYFKVPSIFLLNFIDIMLLSSQPVEIMEFVDVNHGNKSLSK